MILVITAEPATAAAAWRALAPERQDAERRGRDELQPRVALDLPLRIIVCCVRMPVSSDDLVCAEPFDRVERAFPAGPRLRGGSPQPHVGLVVNHVAGHDQAEGRDVKHSGQI